MEIQVLLLVIWFILFAALTWRGIYDLVKLFASFAWLQQEVESPRPPANNLPLVIILLPVLREQRVIASTLRHLRGLDYPSSRLWIVIITTQREVDECPIMRNKLGYLASDIAIKKLTTDVILEKYAGVLPQNLLEQAVSDARHMHSRGEVFEFLETVFDNTPTTMEVVNKYIDEVTKERESPRFVHVHFPLSKGGVNHQLQYAVEKISTELSIEGISDDSTYLAIYNADSQPHPKTLKYVAAMYSDCNKPLVMQQCAVFTKNIDRMGYGLRERILQANAILHTRWVLVNEVPMMRRQAASTIESQNQHVGFWKELLSTRFSYCVGHGLFLRLDLIRKLRMFSLESMSDDILWGLQLSAHRIPIIPIPILEVAESPTTLSSIIAQKARWFLAYLEYPAYVRTLSQETSVNRIALWVAAIQGIGSGIKWLLVSPTILLAFLIPAATSRWDLLMLSGIAYVIYGVASFYLILLRLEVLRTKCSGMWLPLSRQSNIAVAAASLPAFLIDSIGPWRAVIEATLSAISGKQLYPSKTER